MRITHDAMKIIDTAVIKSELVRATGKSYATICRWIQNNDVQLTRKDCLMVIKKETGLNEEQIFGETETA